MTDIPDESATRDKSQGQLRNEIGIDKTNEEVRRPDKARAQDPGPDRPDGQDVQSRQ